MNLNGGLDRIAMVIFTIAAIVTAFSLFVLSYVSDISVGFEVALVGAGIAAIFREGWIGRFKPPEIHTLCFVVLTVAVATAAILTPTYFVGVHSVAILAVTCGLVALAFGALYGLRAVMRYVVSGFKQ